MKSKLDKKINLLTLLSSIVSLSIVTINTPSIGIVSAQQTSSDITYLGVDMSGFYTRDAQARDPSYDLPPNYFEDFGNHM
jgi:hypothetical protein